MENIINEGNSVCKSNILFCGYVRKLTGILCTERGK